MGDAQGKREGLGLPLSAPAPGEPSVPAAPGRDGRAFPLGWGGGAAWELCPAPGTVPKYRGRRCRSFTL